MKNIVGVRFKKLGKIYFFNPKGLKVRRGDFVIVETAQGEEFGEVMIPNRHVEDEKIVAPLKKVIRLANYRDRKHHEECQRIETDSVKTEENTKEMFLQRLLAIVTLQQVQLLTQL